MQEINLYQPVSKGVRGMLSAASSRVTLLVMAAALVGIWAFADWQVQKLLKSAAVIRNQVQAQAMMSAAAGPQLDGLSDEELEALITRLSGSIDAKSRALSLLASESRGGGFSARLRAFGTRHVDGIWLEHLTLGSSVESIGIAGSTLAPELVPRYLQSLSADPALKGGRIDEFLIEKPSKKKGGAGLVFKAGRSGLVAHESKEEEERS